MDNQKVRYCLVAKSSQDEVIGVLDSFFDFEWPVLGIEIKKISKNKVVIYQTEQKKDNNGILIKPWFIRELKSEFKDNDIKVMLKVIIM